MLLQNFFVEFRVLMKIRRRKKEKVIPRHKIVSGEEERVRDKIKARRRRRRRRYSSREPP
tara:strand:- start:1057 stop:1236 length:180 start_codon:yes stop_codon:yes gene_type:complete